MMPMTLWKGKNPTSPQTLTSWASYWTLRELWDSTVRATTARPANSSTSPPPPTTTCFSSTPWSPHEGDAVWLGTQASNRFSWAFQLLQKISVLPGSSERTSFSGQRCPIAALRRLMPFSSILIKVVWRGSLFTGGYLIRAMLQCFEHSCYRQ